MKLRRVVFVLGACLIYQALGIAEENAVELLVRFSERPAISLGSSSVRIQDARLESRISDALTALGARSIRRAIPSFQPEDTLRILKSGRAYRPPDYTKLFVVMDYHLDWIFAALELGSIGQSNGVFPIEPGCIDATQEDIDLLIAFEEDGDSHIILLEAKGVTGWNNKQMDSKADRLGRIFGSDGKRWANVVPHFALVSPRPHGKLNVHLWPRWMDPDGKVIWIRLLGTEGHSWVCRCDQGGEMKAEGGHWTLVGR